MLKYFSHPLSVGFSMNAEARIDSKGRVVLPPEVRRELGLSTGDTVIITKNAESILIARGERLDFIEEFKKVIASIPRRTGKPRNWPPSRMKKIWAEAR